jgi:hypothetical protein
MTPGRGGEVTIPNERKTAGAGKQKALLVNPHHGPRSNVW